MQPVQASMSRRVASSRSGSATTSVTASRPPGRSTRAASASAEALSVERLMTQLEMTTSTQAAGRGMSSISPFRNSTLAIPASSALRRASASISSVMSSPYTLPAEPTRRAERMTSMPPPEPRSSTTSPSRRAATARGLPHPSEAWTAASGTWPSSRALYSPGPKQALPPTPQAQDDPPQQSSSDPSAAMMASSAYFVRTASFVACASCITVSSLAEHLDDQAFAAPAVEFTVEHLLPGTEVQAAVGDRNDHLMVDQQVLQVCVPVVLPAGVVAVVA